MAIDDPDIGTTENDGEPLPKRTLVGSKLFQQLAEKGLEEGEGVTPSPSGSLHVNPVAVDINAGSTEAGQDEPATITINDGGGLLRQIWRAEEIAHQIYTDPDFSHLPGGDYRFFPTHKDDVMGKVLRRIASENCDPSLVEQKLENNLKHLEQAGIIKEKPHERGRSYMTSYRAIADAANAHEKHLQETGQSPQHTEGVLQPPLENFGTQVGKAFSDVWSGITRAITGNKAK